MSKVTKVFKCTTVLAGRDPMGLSSHSAHIGGYSTATAHECMPEDVALQLRWVSKHVPECVYKQLNEQEEVTTGKAIHRGLAAVIPIRQQSVPQVHTGVPMCQDLMLSVQQLVRLTVVLPLVVECVDGRAVCHLFQMGMCLHRTTCMQAHVCFACGLAHVGGRLCRRGQQELGAWLATWCAGRKLGG